MPAAAKKQKPVTSKRAPPSRIAGELLHPAAQLFPMLTTPELLELADDIKANGLRHPIVRHDGKILDGRNRLAACEIAGAAPRFEEWNGKGSATAYAISANLKRRHLNPSQLAMIAADALHLFEVEAKARQKEGARRGGLGRKVTAPGREASKGTAASAAAKAAGAGARSVERAKAVTKKSPELAKRVKAGEVTLKQAEKQIRKKDQIKAVKKYEPPAGSYSVIAADPPWPYEDELDGSDSARGGLPYPAMTIEEICALPVPADKDCALWLWTTNAHLLDGSAKRVLDAWGFEPKTMLTWVKDRMGAGRWLRGITEHCILAVKGKPVVDLKNQTTELRAPRRGHSEKPDEFYALVEELCPATSRLELFARATRSGWVTSGAEAPATKLGVCKSCGCTDTTPCPDGCAWVDADETLCTACVELDEADKPHAKAVVDRGDLCGAVDGKGDPCFHPDGHEGVHSNGRRTWKTKQSSAEAKRLREEALASLEARSGAPKKRRMIIEDRA